MEQTKPTLRKEYQQMKKETIAGIISNLVEKVIRLELDVRILKKQKKALRRELERIKADLEAQKVMNNMNKEMLKSITDIGEIEQRIKKPPKPTLVENTCKDITF